LFEDSGEGCRFGDGSLGLDADLVAGGVDGVDGAGATFVGYGAKRAVLADAKNVSAGEEVAGGSVVEGVVLEGARGVEMEAEVGQAGQEGCWVGDGELKFDLCALHGRSIRLAEVFARLGWRDGRWKNGTFRG
jgi:hypothetical protein